MKPTILVTGGSGSLARHFESLYQSDFQFKFLTRNPKKHNEYHWDIDKGEIDEKSLKDVDHIVHLAGANIAGKRWTDKRKQELRSSRIDSAKLLLRTLLETNQFVETFISASAVGYYGSKTTENIFTEEDKPGQDFLGTLCSDWETAADNFTKSEVSKRSVTLRFGVILDNDSGVIEKIKTPIKLGLGSSLGSGNQYVPWIHIQDACRLIHHAIKTNAMSGPHNAVSPEHITNADLMKTAAQVMNKPYFFPKVPALALNLFFGEMATAILDGSRVSADKAIKAGFRFEYENLESALKDILR